MDTGTGAASGAAMAGGTETDAAGTPIVRGHATLNVTPTWWMDPILRRDYAAMAGAGVTAAFTAAAGCLFGVHVSSRLIEIVTPIPVDATGDDMEALRVRVTSAVERAIMSVCAEPCNRPTSPTYCNPVVE